MARKLKTYQTWLSFFDQAITAPSIKAALEVALDLGPYAFLRSFTRSERFSDIRHKARRNLGGAARGYRDPLFTG